MSEKLSVIIPSYNEKNYLRDCVESILNNNYPRQSLEILIVDGNSNDGTLNIINDLCNKYPNVRLIRNEKKITPVSLNMGLSVATGDFIMISGAHALFPADYIPKLVYFLLKNDADVAGGVLKTKSKLTNARTIAITNVMSNKFGVGNSHFRIGDTKQPLQVDTVPFGVYKREVFQTTGGYNEKLIRNHDIELSKRILKKGFKIFLVPDPECFYFARESYSDLAKNSFRNGMWNVLTVYITKSMDSISVRHYIPFLFILALLTPLIGSIFISPFVMLISASVFIIYLCSITYISFKSSDSFKIFINSVISFLVIHFSYGFGSLTGCLRLKFLLS